MVESESALEVMVTITCAQESCTSICTITSKLYNFQSSHYFMIKVLLYILKVLVKKCLIKIVSFNSVVLFAAVNTK